MGAIKELLQLDISAVIISIFLIMSAIIAGYEIIGKFSKVINKPVKWVRDKDDDHKLLMETVKNLNDLKKHHEDDEAKLYNNLSTYRGQSKEIQDEWKETQEKIFKSIDGLSKKIDDFEKNTNDRFSKNEEKENERVQSEIKDKIAQLYRFHHSTMTITDIELEAIEDLITTYEKHGGENSFVHSLVQKEMYTWQVVKQKN